MVTSLTAFVGQSIGHQMPGDWRWQNRRVRIVDGTTVTMPDTPANQTAFPRQRWEVGLDIRNIKQTMGMGMDKLSRKTPDMAAKEIWVYLLTYNLIRLMMAQQVVGKRPGRIEPQAIKRRPKPYPLLVKPRTEARVEVRKNGHPKKLK